MNNEGDVERPMSDEVTPDAAEAAGPAHTETVLVVDDDPIIARLLEIELLSAGYEVKLSTNGDDALEISREKRPDLILLDVMLPGMDGFEVARQLRADPRTVAVSIIMLTATGLSASRLEGLSAGADDYIVKPFDTPELLARVKGVLRRAREMRAHSPLTGLPGYIRIEEEIERRIEAGEEFAALYADLDNFKAYNEHYGFDRGDEVLRTAGNMIRDVAGEIAGPDTFVGHVGADDFMIVTTSEHAPQIADRLIEVFDGQAGTFYDEVDAEKGYIEIENRRGDMQRYPIVSISIGVSSTDRREFSHYAEVVAVAAEMKEFTKRTPGSVWAADRRTT